MMMSEEEAKDDMANMTNDKFANWMAQNGYQPETQTYNLLTSMKTALQAATRIAQEAARSASYAIKSAHKAQQEAEEARAEAEKKSPVKYPPVKSPSGLPTPRRLTALKPGIRQPARRDDMTAGYQI